MLQTLLYCTYIDMDNFTLTFKYHKHSATTDSNLHHQKTLLFKTMFCDTWLNTLYQNKALMKDHPSFQTTHQSFVGGLKRGVPL
jgi:hypothetical protein